ncbi:Mitochondrial pyruvate carrier 2 [Naganishia adeliensis]|uniref:Mitochondrial pyruvate carrier 2 n=1 Tax=Naganishia adeliensis TaxID=92952 RepID=A0ACC2W2Z7_9TREE|nr:Mitochondrial pyruvate carrier 2 [Naganishia adeliensis]
MSGPVTSQAAARSTSKFQSKWALVIAGVKDLSRPAEKLSVSQNLALAATGFIWVRYSLVITPINYSLAAVNFCVGATGLGQLYRIWDYRRNYPAEAAAKDKIAVAAAATA